MSLKHVVAIVCFLAVISPGSYVSAQEGRETPPAPVVTVSAEAGKTAPQAEFVGTLYYPEVSAVAAEVDGLVDEVNFDEGREVKAGQVLVRLNADILVNEHQAKKAAYEQALTDLEKARLDFARMESLYEGGSISESEYDQYRFAVMALEKKVGSLEAEMQAIRVRLEKKTVRAPFSGVVLDKKVNPGEWASPGAPLAVIARNGEVEAVANVPQEIVSYLPRGLEVPVKIDGRELAGRVFAVVPSGDVSTRTFPLKVRIENNGGLIQGMEAVLVLPTGAEAEALIMPRDALVSARGQTVVFAAVNGQARMFPVEVVGYAGKDVGVRGPGLEPGMQIIVKGNERIRDGQPVAPQQKQ